MFVEGLGPWLGGWGWRLLAASDSLVLAALSPPAQVAALACTTKLAQAMVQFSWIPCDNGLIGLAQLSAEKTGRERLRDALVVMLRVYLRSRAPSPASSSRSTRHSSASGSGPICSPG